MARSINRARPERDIVNRSRYGRYDTRRRRRANIRENLEGWAPKRPEQIPIRIVAPHPYAHHPASPADIRAVLGRLPAWRLNYLTEIRLCRGAEEDLRPAPGTVESHHVVDPWLGRRNCEHVPGIYTGQILGQYFWREAEIRIYAVLFDPGLPDRATFDVLLRRDALTTLVHEVGHHVWRRRRFLDGEEPTSEEFAKQYEYRGVKQYVLPYLEAAYPAEIDRLLGWIERHVGIRLSLAALQPNREDSWASMFSGWTAGSAVEDLLEGLARGDDSRTLRRDFARNLHYGRKFEEALTMVARLLREDPDDFETLDLQICILRDQDRADEMRALAYALTERFPTQYDAWKWRLDADELHQDWAGVLTAAEAIFALPDAAAFRPYQVEDVLLSRACARCELGHLDAADADLDRVSGTPSRRRKQQIDEIRADVEARRAALAEPEDSRMPQVDEAVRV